MRDKMALGLMYAIGRGVKKDHAASAHWLRKAAVQNNSDAQLWLAVKYLKGEGVPHDAKQTMHWVAKLSVVKINGTALVIF